MSRRHGDLYALNEGTALSGITAMGSGSAAGAQAAGETAQGEPAAGEPAQGVPAPLAILALDSALRGCSVALLGGGRLLAEEAWAGPHGQAERLVPMVQRVMAAGGLAFAALDMIAVTIGPGSFTGLRVGLAVARGLALACGRPLLGIGTLEAMAAAVAGEACAGRPLLATIDARRGEIYAQLFAAGPDFAALTAPCLTPLAALPRLVPPGPLVIIGSGSALAAAALAPREVIIPAEIDRPEAAILARLALGRGVPPPGSPPPSPLYLRAPDARLPAA